MLPSFHRFSLIALFTRPSSCQSKYWFASGRLLLVHPLHFIVLPKKMISFLFIEVTWTRRWLAARANRNRDDVITSRGVPRRWEIGQSTVSFRRWRTRNEPNEKTKEPAARWPNEWPIDSMNRYVRWQRSIKGLQWSRGRSTEPTTICFTRTVSCPRSHRRWA